MYLDPGFGSMIIQVIIAFIAAFGAYIVIIRKKIYSFVFRKKPNINGEEMKND